ncbi:MAG: polynucleotide adenylyltransferase PcnB [Methylococcaceae bacterium]
MDESSRDAVETSTPESASCHVYPRAEHIISRKMVNQSALKVLYRLRDEGYQAYLVGGCVRDLLLGREPKDFDVVTDAHPEQVRDIFRNCRLIGRRFRLAHVHYGEDVVEVATFRSLQTLDESDDRLVENGRIIRDNAYGSIEEDAFRRDFTVNALYYNIRDFSVVDYVGGMADHQAGLLRLIGNPLERYREDPVRMLRAVRFAVKLGFTIHPDCAAPIPELAHLLKDISAHRLYEEVLKLFLSGYAVQTFEQLRHYRLFSCLFPQTETCLTRQEHHFPLLFVVKALECTDRRVMDDKTTAPYFLFAALLWEPVRKLARNGMLKGHEELHAYQEAASMVIASQSKRVAIPRGVMQLARDVWLLQSRFDDTSGSKPFRLFGHPRFRAAYDFLLLRAEAGEVDSELADWWQHFIEADEAERKDMTTIRSGTINSGKPKKRRNKSKVSKNVPRVS